MFDVKTYKADGSEGATVRGLTWAQMTSLQSVLSQHGIKHFTKQIDDEAAQQSVHLTKSRWAQFLDKLSAAFRR